LRIYTYGVGQLKTFYAILLRILDHHDGEHNMDEVYSQHFMFIHTDTFSSIRHGQLIGQREGQKLKERRNPKTLKPRLEDYPSLAIDPLYKERRLEGGIIYRLDTNNSLFFT